jgi:hypothetical protein
MSDLYLALDILKDNSSPKDTNLDMAAIRIVTAATSVACFPAEANPLKGAFPNVRKQQRCRCIPASSPARCKPGAYFVQTRRSLSEETLLAGPRSP